MLRTLIIAVVITTAAYFAGRYFDIPSGICWLCSMLAGIIGACDDACYRYGVYDD
jgi:uncharacterized integral membrane protein